MPSTIHSQTRTPSSLTNPPFTLLPLTTPDIPRSVTIYFTSFQNPHSLACWPRTPPIRDFWHNMITTELTDPQAHWFKAVHTPTGAMAGFCKWVQPRTRVPEEDERLPEWPGEADGGLCDETFGAWGREHTRLTGGRGHWYLEILATAPEFQGQGAGSLMMEWGCSKADEGGVEAFLEASPEGVRLYEKFGFVERGKTDTWIENERVKGCWYRNLFMIRQARCIDRQGV